MNELKEFLDYLALERGLAVQTCSAYETDLEGFIEYIKEVQVDFENGMFINMGQILSIPLIIAGGYLIYRSIKWEEAK